MKKKITLSPFSDLTHVILVRILLVFLKIFDLNFYLTDKSTEKTFSLTNLIVVAKQDWKVYK